MPPERADDVGGELACFDWFRHDFPEAPEGMDLARQLGEAAYDGSRWSAPKEPVAGPLRSPGIRASP